MPRSLPGRPRKMLPPPTTMTTCTPNSRTSRTCSAMSCTASGRMPTPPSPPNASPLSLSRIRLYLGWASFFIPILRDAFAHLETDESAHGHFISQLLGDRADVFLHGDFGIALHEALINQAIALVKLFKFAFNDLGDSLRRFVFELLGGYFL